MNQKSKHTADAPVAVLVVGMHRSGTSALTGVLMHAGIELGPRLLAAQAHNPKGYFEHDVVWQIQQRLLSRIGRDLYDLRPLPHGWLNCEPAMQAREELLQCLKTDFGGTKQWAVKDPRTSRLFPLWAPVLSDLGVAQPRVILALRHPIEVAKSLQQRDKLGSAHALAVWLRYTLEGERHTRGFVRSLQHYPEIISDWRGEIIRLAQAIDLLLPDLNRESQNRIDEFLESGLRHHVAHEGDWEGAPEPFRSWCREVFEVMLQVDTDPIGVAQKLDQISIAFEERVGSCQELNEQIGYHVQNELSMGEVLQWRQERDDMLENQIKDYKNHVRGLEGEVVIRQEEIANLTEEILLKNNEIEAMRMSRSWRMTAPLRAALRFVRKRFEK